MSDPLLEPARRQTDTELAQDLARRPVSSRFAADVLFSDAARPTILPYVAADNRRAFARQRARVFGPSAGDMLTADEANARFGVEGYETFDRPVSEAIAAYRWDRAMQRRWVDSVTSRSDISMAESFGATLAGSLVNPEGLPFYALGGEAALFGRLAQAAGRGARFGNVTRGAISGALEGSVGSSIYEGLNFGVDVAADLDPDVVDAVAGVAAGQILGAGLGAVGASLARRGGGASAPPIDPRAWRDAIQRQETGSNPRQISRDPDGPGPAGGGAVGAMQLLPETARAMARRLNVPFDQNRLLNDVEYNQMLGQEYLDFLSDRYDGDVFLATTAYHAGEGNVDRWLRRHGDPRTGQITREQWLERVGQNNPRSARYPREVFEKMGVSLDGGATTATGRPYTPPARPARVLAALSENERRGAFAMAVEAAINDAPVDLGTALARNDVDALNETTAAPSIRGRWLETDVAITRSGGEVPVRFAVVELADLKTSHSDDLTPEPDYPAALQPRDRERAGAQAENYNLERDLNPQLLMRDKAASAGAPIVSPDGVVESGNGRTIALRRSAATGTPAWQRYQAELTRQGVDVSGFDRPVLVRMRSEAMTGSARAEMARQMNLSQVEAYSPVEQARADARRLDRDTLALIEGDDAFAAANRPFLRGFVQRVAPNDANALTDARGAISAAGRTRVQAALVQRAYGDDGLTAALFETADPSIRAIGQALADAAPAWARMRAEAPAAMDLTPNLTGAVALIREARASRVPIAELLEERLGQRGLFGGETLSPETEAFVRLMFRDEALTKPTGLDRIAAALQDYARAAGDTPAGPDLFGNLPDGRAFLETLIARYARAEGDGSRGLAYAGGSEPRWTSERAAPLEFDLRQAGRDGGGRGGSGVSAAGGDEPGGSGEPRRGEEANRAALKGRMASIIASDPELAALAADSDALARVNGLDPEAFPAETDPDLLTEAIRVGANCLATSDFDVTVKL